MKYNPQLDSLFFSILFPRFSGVYSLVKKTDPPGVQEFPHFSIFAFFTNFWQGKLPYFFLDPPGALEGFLAHNVDDTQSINSKKL